MSLIRCLIPALALAITASLAPTVNGQQFDPQLPDLCDLDFDWFKPIYCDCPDEIEPNSGFFFSYSRMNLYGSRPESGSRASFRYLRLMTSATRKSLGQATALTTDTSGYDGSWGNRFNFGFISDDRRGGWEVSAFKLDDPSQLQLEDNIDRNDNVFDDELGDPVGSTSITLNSYEIVRNRA